MGVSEEKENQIDWRLSEEEILHQIMRLYGQDLLYLAFTYLKDRQMAEDVVQDVFLLCYRHLKQFRHESSVKTWIYRITVNRCKDLLKSWSFKNLILSPLRLQTAWSNEPSVEKQLVDKSVSEELSRKVLSLPVKYREVIILFYFENLSLNEISSLLKLSVNSIKSRLHRARKLLGAMYEEGREDDGYEPEKP